MDTQSYTIKDFYKYYHSYAKDGKVYQIDYTTYRKIITDYFLFIRDEVLEKSREFKMPCRLGKVFIFKRKPKSWSKESLCVDFKTTKEIGKVVYHTNEHSDGYKYRFYWKKSDVPLPFKSRYQLIATRHNKRRLAQIVKNREVDYVII